MSYFVLCTFDLKSASRQDYENAYADLKQIGLEKILTRSQGGQTVIPTTTVAGTFNGAGALAVHDAVQQRIFRAFAARGLSSEIFTVAAGDWAWNGATT
jgi:hypothetical protein